MKFTAIYVMWLREMKMFIRAKSRFFGTLLMPLFFLGSFALGFRKMEIPNLVGVSYTQYIIPGIIGMTMLFRSTISGLSVLWDREFGFLKEIMVAPVDRTSIVLGRIAGGVSTALLQGVIIMGLSLFFGFKLTFVSALLSILFMTLIAITFSGFGLIFASQMKDMQGFSLVMNFVIFPLFFLSGAMYPIENLPMFIRVLSYIDPLTYGIDGLRAATLGISSFSLGFDLLVISGFAVIMVVIGTYLFDTSDSV
ncbi:MAG: ABC transporter permease [Nanoarchaeota archaeon]|nr:ABC transporter permease [Nanoarchaeota archaeon]